MIDKEKYPHLYEATEGKISLRRQWLHETLQAQMLCELLPEEIKTLHITDADLYGQALVLEITNEEGTIATLKALGIQGLKPQVSAFSKTAFFSSGEGVLSDGTNLRIHVNSIGEPAGCQVKEKRITEKRYILVCEKSGKEI